MATTPRSSSQNSASTGTAVSVSAPTGTTAGDLVTVVVHVNGQTTIADNNGSTPFTKQRITGDDGAGNFKPNPTSGQTAAVFTRRVQSGDPSTYNFTSGASGRWGVVAVTWQNPNASTIFDVAPVGGNNTDVGGGVLTGSAASITTTTANAIDCPIFLVDGGSAQTITSPGGYTVEQQVPATTQPITFCTAVIATAGATGTRTFSWTTSNDYMALSFAIADIGTGGAAQNLTGAGAIASAEALGAATVTPGPVTASPAGIASGEALSTPRLDLNVTPAGIASSETIGAATVTSGPVTVSPTGIASGEAIGAATVTPGPVTVTPAGIASGEAFGAARLDLNVSPAGIASSEAIGVATITPGPVTVSPTGISSSEAVGSPLIGGGGIASAGGILSGEAFGVATITPGPVTVSPTGIASGETFGLPTIAGGTVTAGPRQLPTLGVG